jgi:phosphohistidine phosphatase
LTDEGREDAYRVGFRLAELGVQPAQVLSSTALRCRETIAALGSGLGRPLEVEFLPKLYNASAHELLEAIAEVDDDVESLLLLAHNPGMSTLAVQLGAARQADLDLLRAGFTPATTAIFSIEGSWSTVSPRTARLARFERPPRA